MSFPIRPNVLKMRPYSPGKPIDEVKRELGLTDIVKLASNENPFGPSPKALAAIQKAASDIHLYPDASAFELRSAIAKRHGLDLGQVMVGSGSDEIISSLGHILLGPGTQLIMGDPSFVRYDSSAHLADAELVKVPLDSEWKHDVRAMAEKFTDQTRLVYIANPNNPTGTVIPHEDILYVLDRLPAGALLVLDEAYFEFAEHLEDFPKSVDLLKAGKPVVILRTFSKAYGLAGLRVGYGLASSEIVTNVDRVRMPFNVNSLAQAAAIAALDDAVHVRKTVSENAAGLERVTAMAEKMGFKVVPSYANFICVDLGSPAMPIFEALLAEGVIVRPGTVLGMPNHLRVSIGTTEEMDVFEKAFLKVAGRAAV